MFFNIYDNKLLLTDYYVHDNFVTVNMFNGMLRGTQYSINKCRCESVYRYDNKVTERDTLYGIKHRKGTQVISLCSCVGYVSFFDIRWWRIGCVHGQCHRS